MPPLDSEITKKYLKAGQAVAHALKLAYKLARPGTNLYDLATILENDIIEQGADGWSFPANISLDVEAAHYSPIIDDSKRTIHLLCYLEFYLCWQEVLFFSPIKELSKWSCHYSFLIRCKNKTTSHDIILIPTLIELTISCI